MRETAHFIRRLVVYSFAYDASNFLMNVSFYSVIILHMDAYEHLNPNIFFSHIRRYNLNIPEIVMNTILDFSCSLKTYKPGYPV